MDMAVRMVLAVLLATGLAACGGDDGGLTGLSVSNPIASVAPDDPLDDQFATDQRPPSAVAAATPRFGPPPLAVVFSATGSGDPDGAILSYRWDFGDGSEGFGVTVNHVYTQIGAFTARLTVTDNDGAIDTTSVLVEVRSADENLPPSATFSAEPREGAAPLAVGFDASSATDSDGGIVEYRWDFGDGSEGFGVTAGHTYTQPGVFVAQLIVVDDDGAEGSASLPITVLSTADLDAGDAPARAAAAADLVADGAVGAGGRQRLQLELAAGATVRVDVEDHAAAEPDRNDLDVYLFDSRDPQRPRYLASSVGSGAREFVTAPAAGRYELLIESSAGSSRYRVALEPGVPEQTARLEDEFVSGELIVQLGDGVSPPLAGLQVIAGAPPRPMLMQLLGAGTAATDSYWPQSEAISLRYATVRAVKRLRQQPGIVSADLNWIHHSKPRAMVREETGMRALRRPQALPAADESGAMTRYELIDWLWWAAGLSGESAPRADLIELRLPAASPTERAAIEAATTAGAVVVTAP